MWTLPGNQQTATALAGKRASDILKLAENIAEDGLRRLAFRSQI